MDNQQIGLESVSGQKKIDYEIKPKGTPFFGATTLAEDALSLYRGILIDPDQFCNYLINNYDEDGYNPIEYISFYDFKHANRGYFHFTIAVIYTVPDRMIRDRLFQERAEITKETGWYPLVTGSRANYTHGIIDISTYKRKIKAKKIAINAGCPEKIRNIAADLSSNAFLLQCSKGSILLDTGFGISYEDISTIRAIFLSHFHKDHSGGLIEILRKRDIPVLMSMLTLEQLLHFCHDDSDRNAYLPGWETPKLRSTLFTRRYGLISDCFSEFCHAMRKYDFTNSFSEYFTLNKCFNTRDTIAVGRTFSGLAKLIYPDERMTKEEVREVLYNGTRKLDQPL